MENKKDVRTHAGSEKCEKKTIHTTEPIKGSETDNSRYSMSNRKRWEVTKGREFCKILLRSKYFYHLTALPPSRYLEASSLA